MKDKRDKLLISAVFMILYLLMSGLYLIGSNKFVTSNNLNTILNIIEFIFGIIGTIYFIILSQNENIDLRKRSLSIFITSIFFFMVNIISGILGFIVYNSIKKVKRELPVLEDINEHSKRVYLFTLLISLFILFVLSNYLTSKLGFILIYLSIFLIMTFTFKEQLKRDFCEFKKYFREYNILVLKTWGKSLVILIILSLSIQLITNLDNSTNQLNLQKMFDKNPLLIIILAMFYAPIAEELMFRGVFKKLISNKYLFIFISGVLFGLVHVIDDFKTPAELSYILVYSSLGWFLASLYSKTNNICSNIFFHFLQNTLSIIGMILLHFM